MSTSFPPGCAKAPRKPSRPQTSVLSKNGRRGTADPRGVTTKCAKLGRTKHIKYMPKERSNFKRILRSSRRRPTQRTGIARAKPGGYVRRRVTTKCAKLGRNCVKWKSSFIYYLFLEPFKKRVRSNPIHVRQKQSLKANYQSADPWKIICRMLVILHNKLRLYVWGRTWP